MHLSTGTKPKQHGLRRQAIRTTLSQRLKEGVFFLDGAMGTQLFARGIQPGQCVERLNAERAELVAEVHRDYLNAGVDAVLTNTFGGNSISLGRHRLADKTEHLNRAAAELARREAGEDRWVLGDIGPCGDFLEPLGMLQKADLKNGFCRQVRGLLEGGVDGLLIETMTALEEIETAVEAIQELTDLPILVSLAFDPAQGFRTMMGVSPARAVERLVSRGITALGFNCGTLDMPDYVWLARELADRLTSKGVLLLAEPNAGRPRLEGSSAVYDLSPEDFAEGLEQIYRAGAVILGGCCGTTPRHLAAAVKRLRG